MMKDDTDRRTALQDAILATPGLYPAGAPTIEQVRHARRLAAKLIERLEVRGWHLVRDPSDGEAEAWD